MFIFYIHPACFFIDFLLMDFMKCTIFIIIVSCFSVSEDSLGEKSKMNQNKNKAKSGNKNIDIIEVVTIDDEDEITEDTSAAETLTTISSSIS